ncbi:unnamed protein product [Durusdinium trenchii]|uniref:HMG domain-containing protein n=1 Tax=Durusdinium trenchii TaxID=1381693 RepID=A0ABP0K6D7_9DINO
MRKALLQGHPSIPSTPSLDGASDDESSEGPYDTDRKKDLSSFILRTIDDVAGAVSSVGQAVRNCRNHCKEVGFNRLNSQTLAFVKKSKINAARNFFSFCHVPVETATIRAPVRDRKSRKGFKWMNIEMLEPYSVIQYLWCTVGLEIDDAQLHNFWAEHRARGTPWAVATETDFIPLALYGDGCRIRQVSLQPVQKAIGIFLSCPLYRPKGARACRWLLCTLDENLLYKEVTLNKIFARIVWSLNLLWEDRFPACDPFGQPVPERFRARIGTPITGKRFQVVEFRGDWVWQKQVFRFNSTWLAGARKPVCFACPAYRTGQCRYTDVTESSPLWDRQYTYLEFLNREMPASGLSPVLLLRGFHHSCLALCSMHIINLGLMYGVNGSCLMTILESTEMFGRYGEISLQEQMDLAYQDFKQFLRASSIPCSQPAFTVKLVVKKNGEVLMTGKAYNNRCIQLWLEKVMRSAAGDYLHADERIGNMSVCMTALARFMHLIEASPRFLSVEQAAAIHREGMLFARLHVLLNHQSARHLDTYSFRFAKTDAIFATGTRSWMKTTWDGCAEPYLERTLCTRDRGLCGCRSFVCGPSNTK